MLVLRTTTATLQLQAGSGPSADIPIHVSFEEIKDAQTLARELTPGLRNPQYQHSKIASGSTSATTILSAPATGLRRIVREIFVKNAANAAIAYSFNYVDSAATPTTVSLTFTLAVGDNLQYVDGRGWWVTDTNGYTK